jgi:hypothetical protein
MKSKSLKTRVSTSKQGAKIARHISKLSKSSQSEKFISERSPTFQYLIDVAALAFVLTTLVLMLGRVH